MITYYGYTISPNQIETGEGFLICRNVPIARTGTQDYTGAEVGKDGVEIVTVNRPEEEVFSPAALASFEGKPFTDDHPPVLLTPENAGQYEKGHVQNVRRGTGEFSDFVVADIHVHDAAAISAIQNGKRQISCGYECEYEENPDGTLTQKQIRGNHVALVDVGRAGTRAAIMDANKTKAADPPERTRRPMSKRNAFLHLFGMAANGRTDEEIRRLAEDAAPVMDEDTAPEKEPEGEPIPEEDAKPCGDAAELFQSIDGKLDKLIELLTPQKEEPEEGDPEEEEKDPLDEALETIGNEIKGREAAIEADEDPAEEPGAEQDEETAAEAEEAHVIPAEEMDGEAPAEEEEKKDGEAMDAYTARNLITAMRPVIAGITNEKERKAATDALLALVKRPTADSDAAKIAKAAQKNAKTKAQSRPVTDLEAIQKMYDARNPHKNKEA